MPKQKVEKPIYRLQIALTGSQVLSAPNHPDNEELREWVGEIFDPKLFSKDEVNLRLKEKNYGCISIY